MAPINGTVRANVAGAAERGSSAIGNRLMLCLVSTLVGSCWFESTPTTDEGQPERTFLPTSRWMPGDDSREILTLDASMATDASTRPLSAGNRVMPDAGTTGVDAGSARTASDSGLPPMAAGGGQPDSGQLRSSSAAGGNADPQPADAAMSSPPDMTSPVGCRRDALSAGADAYLKAMADGAAQTLSLDPNIRYTEDGEVRTIGSGLWLSRPQPNYARHILDEQECSSLTVAVLTAGATPIIFAARLFYAKERLLEVETTILRRNGQYFDPQGIIPEDVDHWTEPVEASMRMSRMALMGLAEDYFNSTVEPSRLPPHAPGCTVLQNGARAGLGCGDTPGNQRYMQLRYPVLDETAGVATAIAWGSNRVLGMYFFKAKDDVMQNIEAIGGNYTAKTGW